MKSKTAKFDKRNEIGKINQYCVNALLLAQKNAASVDEFGLLAYQLADEVNEAIRDIEKREKEYKTSMVSLSAYLRSKVDYLES